jgi:hypothetical protein
MPDAHVAAKVETRNAKPFLQCPERVEPLPNAIGSRLLGGEVSLSSCIRPHWLPAIA